jgi:hypothetical protein
VQEIGIEVGVENKLPTVNVAYTDYLRREKEARSVGKAKPTKQQASVEQFFPAIARWVRGYGHIEIGDQESFGFVVRALDYGGLVFEDDRPDTLAEALAALEKALAEQLKEDGVELE